MWSGALGHSEANTTADQDQDQDQVQSNLYL